MSPSELRQRIQTLLEPAGVTLDGPAPWDLRVHDPQFYARVIAHGSLGLGEAYMDGWWDSDDLDGLLTRLLAVHVDQRVRGLDDVLLWLKAAVVNLQRGRRAYAVGERHYDIGNDLFERMLGRRLVYSCAYWREAADLDTAQAAKLDLVCRKLGLAPGQRVLDIGSGWGSMAIYLAENCGVEVLGVTLSTEQHALATQRAAERGLSDRVKFELRDYREVEGPFDRIVSVGMFEHVGLKNIPEFFQKVRSLLKPDGVALLHSIGRKGGPGSTGAWVRKYIFPGGYAPALSETLPAIEQAKLWVTDIEIWRLHYAETCLAWGGRFAANRDKAAAMLGDRFCRMWEFYLLISEFSFRYGKHMVFQIQMTRDVDAVPLARDYMGEAEKRLEAGEAGGAKALAG